MGRICSPSALPGAPNALYVPEDALASRWYSVVSKQVQVALLLTKLGAAARFLALGLSRVGKLPASFMPRRVANWPPRGDNLSVPLIDPCCAPVVSGANHLASLGDQK